MKKFKTQAEYFEYVGLLPSEAKCRRCGRHKGAHRYDSKILKYLCYLPLNNPKKRTVEVNKRGLSFVPTDRRVEDFCRYDQILVDTQVMHYIESHAPENIPNHERCDNDCNDCEFEGDCDGGSEERAKAFLLGGKDNQVMSAILLQSHGGCFDAPSVKSSEFAKAQMQIAKGKMNTVGIALARQFPIGEEDDAAVYENLFNWFVNFPNIIVLMCAADGTRWCYHFAGEELEYLDEDEIHAEYTVKLVCKTLKPKRRR